MHPTPSYHGNNPQAGPIVEGTHTTTTIQLQKLYKVLHVDM